jgi:hypothetical protein
VVCPWKITVPELLAGEGEVAAVGDVLGFPYEVAGVATTPRDPSAVAVSTKTIATAANPSARWCRDTGSTFFPILPVSKGSNVPRGYGRGSRWTDYVNWDANWTRHLALNELGASGS